MNFQKISTLDVEVENTPPAPAVKMKEEGHKTDSEKMCDHEKEIYGILNQLRRRIDDLEKDNDVHRERISYIIGLIKEAKLWK